LENIIVYIMYIVYKIYIYVKISSPR